MQNVITQISYRLPEAFVNGFRDFCDCRYSAGVWALTFWGVWRSMLLSSDICMSLARFVYAILVGIHKSIWERGTREIGRIYNDGSTY